MQRVGVPAHRVATSFDTLADPQLEARRHIISIEHTRLGAIPVETSRMRFSRTPAIGERAAPEIGQHNDYVLRELLRLTDDEIGLLVSGEALE